MEKESKTGLFRQIYTLLFISIIIMGVITAIIQILIAAENKNKQTKVLAEAASAEVMSAIREYPAYLWLLDYWATHADSLSVEYDTDFSKETVTKQKASALQAKYPNIDLRYCKTSEIEAFPREDQKLYAEVVYSQIIFRINEIKRNFGCTYLFCAVTDTDEGPHPYETMLYLFSGADIDSVRGQAYGQVYTLGVRKAIAEEVNQREILKQAVANEGKDAIYGEPYENAGSFIDYYTYMTRLDHRAVLVGVSFDYGHTIESIFWSGMIYTLCFIALGWLLLNLAMLFVTGFLLNPMRKVLAIIRDYTLTKNSEKTEKIVNALLSGKTGIAIRNNEVGQLADDFISLTHEMDAYTTQIKEVVAAQERMAFELETAAVIQQRMLPEGFPRFTDHPEVSLCASMVPAKEVGGDFYDYFFTDDTHLMLVMADVSDKGVPAALFAAEAKTLIRSRAQLGENPEQILYHVNNQLSAGNDKGFFVTVWLAMLNLETGEGVAVNAGHEHPCLCRKGGHVTLVKYKHSPALGLMAALSYPQHDFRLYSGDRLLVYTDGVPEAQNEALEMFGTDRMLDVLRANQHKATAELLAALTKAIDDFTGDASRFDDTTMMCLSYEGKRKEKQDDH